MRKGAFLSMLIMIALSAAMVPAASAAPQLTAGNYPVALQAHNGERKYTEIVTELGSIVCEVKYRGEISEPTAAMTIDPTYANCGAFGSYPPPTVEINNTGCVYVLHPNEEVAEGEYSGDFDLECETGKALKGTVLSCQLEINEQTGLSTVKLTNQPGASPKPRVAVDFEVESLDYTVTKDGTACPFQGTGTRTEGELVNGKSLVVSGHDPAHPAIQVGIDVGEGKGEEEPAIEAPEITAASYPVTFVSASPVNEIFAIEVGGEAKQVEECESSFHGEATGPSAEIDLAFEQTGCSAVNAGECFYRLDAGEPLSEDSFAASLDIVCPGEGTIEFPTEKECRRITVPEQDGLRATVLTNHTGASPRDIGVTLTVEGIYSYDTECIAPWFWKWAKLNGQLTIEGLTLEGLNPKTLSPVAIEVAE